MPRVGRYDVVIIGGGCAGLSLARELCAVPNPPKTLVLESRQHYTNDRTWCFWADEEHTLKPLVSHSWSHWDISSSSGSGIAHSASDVSYQMIRSEDFYNHALSVIDLEPNVSLQTQAQVLGIRKEPNQLEIGLADSLVYGRRVVDTRPPPRTELEKSTLLQCFMGKEVTTEQPVFNPKKAGLMTGMRCDELGFRFLYVLPLSSRRALIETTRFSATLCPKAQLARDLEQDISVLLGGQQWGVDREEYGALPMGMPVAPATDSGVYRAGISGGALRAATGYGFQNIQSWATNFASFLAGHDPLARVRERKLEAFMDDLFLRTVRRHPERAAEFFLAVAEALDGEQFAEFMSRQPRASIWRRVVRALPPGPFISSLFSGPVRALPQGAVAR